MSYAVDTLYKLKKELERDIRELENDLSHADEKLREVTQAIDLIEESVKNNGN